MIDRTKNLCYIVTVHYLAKKSRDEVVLEEKTFISLHSIDTKKCRDFAKRKAKKDKRFWDFDSDGWLSQYTVPLIDLCK